jgi:hypothetical protein
MVEPDDVKKVRRTLEDTVEEKKTETATSSSKRFIVSIASSFAFLLVILVLVFSGSLVTAVTISDVGGFHAEIGRVEGTGVTMYPVVGETSVCRDESGASPDPDSGEEALPMLRVDVAGASVGQYQPLEFRKDIYTPNILGMAGVRITVTRPTGFGKVELGDASIQLTRLDANEIYLENDLVIDDRNATTTFGDPPQYDYQEPGGEFIFEGQDAYIEDAEAVVHYVSFSELSMPQMRLELEYVEDENDLDYAERVDCPVAGPAVLVNIQDTNAPIDPGETLNVTATFTNPSATEGVGSSVYLDLGNDSAVDSDYVYLSGQESETVTFSYDTDGVTGGAYDAVVRSDYDEDSESVIVGDPAFFDVNITGTNSPVEPGDDVTVNVTVENIGDVTDDQSVELSPDGFLRDSMMLSLDGGESSDETLIWETEEDQPIDNYTATVSTDDSSDTETVQVVVQDDFFDVEVTNTNSPVAEGDDLTVGYEVTNLGESAGTQELNLSIYEDANTPYETDVDNGTETLNPDENATGSFVWSTAVGDAGEYQSVVASEDTMASVTAVVGDFVEQADIAVVGSDAGYRTEIQTALQNNLGSDFTVSTEPSSDVLASPGTYTDTYDVFVVNAYNNGTDSVVEGFLDEVNQSDNGLVSLENWGSGSDAITRLSDIRGNPTSVSDSFSGTSPVRFTIEQNHPIFDGVGSAGDTVNMYSPSAADRAWFSGYSGPTLAEVNTSDGDGGGPAASVDGNHCLLSLGRTTYTAGGFTSDANRTLANCAEYVSPDIAPEFNVQITNVNDSVAEGEDVEVEAEIQNTGDVETIQTVTLTVDGEQVDAKNVGVSGGGSTTETFVWSTESGDGGSHTATVSSDDDSASTTVDVLEPAFFDVTVASTNEPIMEGGTLTVDAYVHNTGGVQGTQTVTLDVEGEGQVDSLSVTRDGGVNQTVMLEWNSEMGDNSTSVREVNVSSEDDSDTDLIEVQEAQYQEPEPGDTGYDEYIDAVRLREIDHTSGDNGGYANFTDTVQSATLARDGSYTIEVDMNTSGYPEHTSVWIDWDQDYRFEDSERIYLGSGSATPIDTVSDTVDVPSGATLGETRMRVVQRYNTEPTDPTPTGYFGETEDYTVAVAETVDPTQVPPNKTLSTGFEHLDQFSFGDSISTNTDETQGYRDFTQDTDLVAAVRPGETIDVEMVTDGTGDAGVAIWIDTNRDGDFDLPSERLFARNQQATPNTFTGTVTIPSDAEPGATTLRAGAMYITDGSAADPETYSSFGELQDFTVYVFEGG